MYSVGITGVVLIGYFFFKYKMYHICSDLIHYTFTSDDKKEILDSIYNISKTIDFVCEKLDAINMKNSNSKSLLDQISVDIDYLYTEIDQIEGVDDFIRTKRKSLIQRMKILEENLSKLL
jgi:hypothetical protein